MQPSRVNSVGGVCCSCGLCQRGLNTRDLGTLLLSTHYILLHFSKRLEQIYIFFCSAGWGISWALPSRFSSRFHWKWPGRWCPVPPACPHLQPPTCEETHLLWGPVKQPEQGCAAPTTVFKPWAAAEQVTSLTQYIWEVWPGMRNKGSISVSLLMLLNCYLIIPLL